MTHGLAIAERDIRLARYYDLDFVDVHYDAELYQQFGGDRRPFPLPPAAR